MRHLIIFASLALSTIALGCHGPDSAASLERTAKAESPIVYGEPDKGHQAVVYVDLGGGSCTGTIIAACNGTGYVLTAAHCCEGPVSQAIMADDAYDFNAQTFPAFDTEPDPDYWGPSDHDFCMFKISGVDESTPVIPAMTPEEDNLKISDMVEFVGYGVTEYDDYNTQRRHVSDDISELSEGVMAYDQQPGGPCNGDSGGPALSIVGGSERVSGVTSQGDDYCISYGESGRVSFVYDSFILPYLGSCVPSSGSSSGGSGGTGGSFGGSSGSGGSGGSPGAGGSSSGGFSGSSGSGGSFGGSSFGGGGTGEGGSSDDDGNNSSEGSCAVQAADEGNPGSYGIAVALGLACAALGRRRRSRFTST
jgi:MYXO-CTERM domain-containing protein